MAQFLQVIFSALGYIFTGLIIIALLLSLPIHVYNRKMYLTKIEEMITKKDYVRLLLISLFISFVYITAINLAAYKTGLTADRFWALKSYTIALLFIFGTLELAIKRKILWIEAKSKLKEYPFGVVCFLLLYLLGGISLGYLIFSDYSLFV